MSAVTEAIVALRRVENEQQLPHYVLRAAELCLRIFRRHCESEGREGRHLRAVEESETVGAA